MIVFCSYYTHLKSIILAKIRNIAYITDRAQIPQSETDILAPPLRKGGKASTSASLLYGSPLPPRRTSRKEIFYFLLRFGALLLS